MQGAGNQLAAGKQHGRSIIVLMFELQCSECQQEQHHKDADNLRYELHSLPSPCR